MAASNTSAGDGCQKTTGSSVAERIASLGISTPRHLSNFALGVGVDILRGQVGSRDGHAVLASVRETRRSIELGQKIGQNKDVLDAPGEQPATAAPSPDDPLLAEEQTLTARLEEIREQRAARERRSG